MAPVIQVWRNRGVATLTHTGTPIGIEFRPIWDGDKDWYAMLVDQAVVVPTGSAQHEETTLYPEVDLEAATCRGH